MEKKDLNRQFAVRAVYVSDLYAIARIHRDTIQATDGPAPGINGRIGIPLVVAEHNGVIVGFSTIQVDGKEPRLQHYFSQEYTGDDHGHVLATYARNVLMQMTDDNQAVSASSLVVESQRFSKWMDLI